MPIVRIRMGWKPVPSPVLEQTLETEPPMFTACTFAEVEGLVDEFKAQGIEKAELQLVGWNLRGHDGRWPQAFPVEEAMGGEEAMRHLIQHVKEAGYRLVCHTNVNDAYRIADCWDENNIMRTKQGAIRTRDEVWSGGRMYHMCLEPANRIQLPILDHLKDMGCDGFHYIDVLAIVDPRTCYHPDHPMNADEYVVKAREILAAAQERMGGSSSEGGIDFAAGCLDFALYIAFNIFDRRPPVADEPIPLWQLVYHGYILSNASAETVNSMVKPPKHWLKAFEYGSIPAVYYYSRFVGGERRNWMGDNDMRFSTPEELHESVRLLKEYLDRYEPYKARQLATMDNHERWADGVYCATYSDGWRVVVNYNEQPYEGHGVTVPAQDAVQLPPV